MDIKFKQNHVNINMKATGGVGTKDHSKLTNLDYEHSGHTGFASAAQIQELLDLLNNKQDTLIAGDNITIVDNIISATGLTKDEIYIGPDEPADPNIKIWIDTNEVAQEFYTKEEIDAKNFATEGWVSAQGYLTQHQDLSEYAKKSEIPTKVSAFENDAGYLTEHQDLSEYALKTEIPTVPTNVSAFNNDAGYLTEHQSLADYALKTELPTEYVKSATVQGNKLTLTNKDNTTVEFEPSGGGSGGASADESTIITNSEGKLETVIGGKWVDGLVDGPVIVNLDPAYGHGGELGPYLTYDIMQELISKGDKLRASLSSGFGKEKGCLVDIDTSVADTYKLTCKYTITTVKIVYVGTGTKDNWKCSRHFEGGSTGFNSTGNYFYSMVDGKVPSPINSADFLPISDDFKSKNNKLSLNWLEKTDKKGFSFNYNKYNEKGKSSGEGSLSGGYSCYNTNQNGIAWGSSVRLGAGNEVFGFGNQIYTNGNYCSYSFITGIIGYIAKENSFVTGIYSNWYKPQNGGEGVAVFGQGNTPYSDWCLNHGKWSAFDTNKEYAHIVGNGTSNTSRSNAYTLDWQGNGTFAGTVSSSTGADYAEYFEWKDGNPNNEDRVGYIVTLDGDKIVKANTGDDILGICSGTAMVLGDSAEWNWNKRYLTDDFGRIIYEDRMEHHEAIYNPDGELIEEAWDEEVHAPKQNPEYNASRAYIKRADRPEWQIVGMMGKLYVRDDGSCVVNSYADVKDGIATKANGKTNMRVMERVSDNIVRVLMK